MRALVKHGRMRRKVVDLEEQVNELRAALQRAEAENDRLRKIIGSRRR